MAYRQEAYLPPPVKTVLIPKRSVGEWPLGIFTVSDRIAKTVVKAVLEPLLEVEIVAGLISASDEKI